MPLTCPEEDCCHGAEELFARPGPAEDVAQIVVYARRQDRGVREGG